MFQFRFLCCLTTAFALGSRADIVLPPTPSAAAPKKEEIAEPAPVQAKEEKKAENLDSLRQIGVGRARYTLLALHSAHVNAAYRALCTFLGETTVAAQGIDKVYEVLDAAINRNDYGDYRIEEQKQKGRFYTTTITRTVTREWLLSKLDGLPELRQKLQEKAGCTH